MVKRLRGPAKEKFLTCLLVQEIVEDPQTAERFRGWARRWGKMKMLQRAGRRMRGYFLFDY